MSIQISGAVKECGPRQLTQYAVLDALANYADDFGFCFPSIATLSHISRCDERTVRRQIVELEHAGWLFVTRKALNGRGNVYQINLGKIGVTVPCKARRSPLFTRLLKTYGGAMSPIFAPETPEDTTTFSEDNPQPLSGLSRPTQRTNEGGSEDIACPPNRYNRQEPSMEPSTEKNTPLPPLVGVERAPGWDALWSGLLVALKADLAGAPTRFAGGALREIVPGQNDFETCFRDWWLESGALDGNRLTLVTGAADPVTARHGLEKYRGRLERLAREAFSLPRHVAVSFELRQTTTQTPAA